MNSMVTRAFTWHNATGKMAYSNPGLSTYVFERWLGVGSSPMAIGSPTGNLNPYKQYPWHSSFSFEKGHYVKGYQTGSNVRIQVPAELAAGVIGSMFIEVPASYLKKIELSHKAAIINASK